MDDYKYDVLKIRAIRVLAEQRALAVATSEVGFRDSFAERRLLLDPEEINLVYARVNARYAHQEGYTIHLNILPHETSLTSLKCIKMRPDNLVEPHHLAEELTEYLLERDNKSGILVLAIDRVHMLTSNKRKILLSIFHHYERRFAVVLLLPKQDWEYFILHDIYYKELLHMTTYQLKSRDDIERLLVDNGKSIDFDDTLPW